MAAHAGQYDDFAVISSTLGVQDGRVCVGEASRGDIGCPTYAPYVGADGSISATRFVGDGSGLFNIAGASADRIVSGTTSMLAISDTGYISITQSGYNTAYFHPTLGLVAVGVSSTGGISGTTGYFSGKIKTNYNIDISSNLVNPLNLIRSSGNGVLIKVSNSEGAFYMGMGPNENFGIGPSPNMAVISGLPFFTVTRDYKVGAGILNPSRTLHISGTALTTSWTGINFSNNANVTPTAPLEVSGTVSATAFVGDGSGLTGVVASTGDRIVSNTTSMVADGTSGYISVTQAGYNTAYFHPTLGLVAVGISTTGRISTTDLAVRGVIDTVSGTNNVLVGQDAGELRTYTSNATAAVTAVGYQAGYKTYGAYVTLMGYQAGYNNSGTQVSAFGKGAAYDNTGNYLTAAGTNAAMFNTGHTTTAAGYGAASYNTGSSTVALGHRAGTSNTKDGLTAVGYYSGFYNSGLNGSFHGYDAGRGNSGANVTALGYEAGYGGVNNTFNNVTLLGANTRANKDNQVVLGDPNTTEVTTTGVILAAGLGIGVTAPATNLEVSGTISATAIQVAATLPDSACAGPADLGKMRRNPTTGRMQLCR